MASTILENAGFDSVYEILGVVQWEAAGGPFEVANFTAPQPDPPCRASPCSNAPPALRPLPPPSTPRPASGSAESTATTVAVAWAAALLLTALLALLCYMRKRSSSAVVKQITRGVA